MNKPSAESLRAELSLLAARFVLPGTGPDVDRAIRIACDLLAAELDTPATIEVAGLRYGTPLRDAGPTIREMLAEQGFPAAEPDSDEAAATLLRAVATGGLLIGEFYIEFLRISPAWADLNERQRSLAVLLNNWTDATTPEDRSQAESAVCAFARDALDERRDSPRPAL
jgi:hypothetical protein